MVIPELRFRFPNVGKVLGYSQDEYWVGKGTPIAVEFDFGSKPANFQPILPFLGWIQFQTYFFSASELVYSD